MKIVNSEHIADLLDVVKNTGLGIIGRVFFLGIRFASIVLITRNLGSELYGVFIIAISVLEIAAAFASVGLGAAMIKFGAQFIESRNFAKLKGLTNYSLKTTMFASVLVIIFVILFASFASNRIFLKPELALPLRIAILGLPFFTVTLIFMGLFQGAKLLKYRILIERFLRPVIRLIFTVIVLGLGFKLLGVLWAWICAIVISLLFTVFLVQKKMKHFFINSDQIDKKEILSYSVPLWGSNLIMQNNRNIGVILIGAYLTSEQVGIYGVGFRMIPYLLIPFFAYNAILSPMIASLFTRGDLSNFEKLYKTGSRWIITFTLPLFVLMVFYSKDICRIFGSDFSDSARIMVILLTAQMINICTGSSHYILTMTGKSNYALLNSIFYFVSTFILTISMIKIYGTMGAAFGFGISLVLLQIVQLFEVWKLYKFHPYSFQHIKPIVACICSVVIFLFLNNVFGDFKPLFSSLVPAAIFLMSYPFFVRLLKLSPEDNILLDRLRFKFFRILKDKRSSCGT